MQRSSIEYAVRHVARFGDTDVFPFPSENHVFHDAEEDAVSLLQEADTHFDEWLNLDATEGISAMAPVGYTGFRWATQLDPLWNAYFLALVVELAPKSEALRVSADVVHSHRVEVTNNDALYRRDAYLAFEAASRATAEDHEWVVLTDIADFYPRIYHHRLENALREVDNLSDIPKRIITLLKLWSKNTSYGLPIGGPAARLLAELALSRTDKLLQVSGHVFHRYADDYRLFAQSKQEAHRALTDLSGILLRNEGLALNKAKTRIMSRAEFLSTIEQDGDDAQALAELTPEEQSRRRRARELLGLTLRYDPYAATAVEDYEALKEAVERLDIVDLFTMELSKPRVNPRLARKLLRALQAADPTAKASICTSLVMNLELLAPLIPQVLQAIRGVLSDIDEQVARDTRAQLARQLQEQSHLFQVQINLAFAVRVLADDPSGSYQMELARLFEAAPPFIQRDIVIAMARWRASYWVSDKKGLYDSVHPWVRRALLLASYRLGDEGSHWRNAVGDRLTAFDKLTRDWASQRVQTSGWELPL